MKQNSAVRPAEMLNRIGRSSEWSGDTKPAATSPQSELKPWKRSVVRKTVFFMRVCKIYESAIENADDARTTHCYVAAQMKGEMNLFHSPNVQCWFFNSNLLLFFFFFVESQTKNVRHR